MATPSKTTGIVVLAHQAVTHPATVVSAEQDVGTAIQVTLVLDQGFVEVAANTNPATWFIDISVVDTGNEDWATIQEIPLTEDGTPADETISGVEAIGQKVIEVAATAGFGAQDLVYIQDVGVVIDGEWARVARIVTNVSIDLIDGLTNAKGSSDIIFGAAERIIVTLNLESIARYRVIYSHEGAVGVDTHIKATATVEDSFG